VETRARATDIHRKEALYEVSLFLNVHAAREALYIPVHSSCSTERPIGCALVFRFSSHSCITPKVRHRAALASRIFESHSKDRRTAH
jgi:hypothetical protein